MSEAGFHFIFKSAVALVDIKIIAFVGVVGDKYIEITVAVNVADGDAEAKADEGAVDAGFTGDFCKMAVIIPEQVVSASFEERCYRPLRIREVPAIGVVERVDRDRAIIDHKAVEVAVVVIIEKRDLGSIGGDVQAVLTG